MPNSEHSHEQFRGLWPADWNDLTVLAAVSGGADSVALLRALDAAGQHRPGRLIVAHFNHALRPEAPDDEHFVVALSSRLGLQCVVGHGRPPPSATGVEETARRARYDFLRATAADVGARYVVTAHTADDQAETVLHRILRGTGISGLAGMRRARPLCPGITLLRPLLTMRRAELLAYLQSLNQAYRDDATNLDSRFTRNRLRHSLLPQLANQYNPGVVEALLRLSQLAAETQAMVDARVSGLLRHVRVETQRIRIAVAPVANEPRHIIRELLLGLWRRQGWPEQSMGFDEWEALAGHILAPDGRAGKLGMLPGDIMVSRLDDSIVLEAAQASNQRA